MNENAKKWIAALRSNKYKKAKGQLHYEEGKKHFYCCFGVACDLYQKESDSKLLVEKFRINEKGISKRKYFSYDACVGNLPEKVINWLGIRDSCGSFDSYFIIKFNDTDDSPDVGEPEPEFTFKEIANIIEKNKNVIFKG